MIICRRTLEECLRATCSGKVRHFNIYAYNNAAQALISYLFKCEYHRLVAVKTSFINPINFFRVSLSGVVFCKGSRYKG